MKAERREIDEHTWMFDEGGVRFYLMEGSERALLIDSGMETHNAAELAAEVTNLPVELLNTHADMDHVGSVAEFGSFYMAAEDEPQYREQHGELQTEIKHVKDGSLIDLGGRVLEIIAMPGHTPGSIAVLDRANRRLFSGDPVQKNGDIFMFGKYRNMPAYIESMRRLETMKERFDEIWPAHADCPITAEVIPALIDGAERILRGELTGPEKELFGNRVRTVDAGVSRFLVEA